MSDFRIPSVTSKNRGAHAIQSRLRDMLQLRQRELRDAQVLIQEEIDALQIALNAIDAAKKQ